MSFQNKILGITALTIIASISIFGCSAIKAESSQSSASKESSSQEVSSTAQSSKEEETDSKVQETAVSYKNYVNERFGFSIDYPSTLGESEDPVNGDGKIFKSDDKTVSLTVFGSNNTGNLGDAYSAKDYFNEVVLPTTKNPTYKEQKDNFYIVSWLDGGEINYIKGVVGEKSINQYTLKYPESKKTEFDEIIKKINSSFKTPQLNSFH